MTFEAIPFPFDALVFMLPRGRVRHPTEGDCPFLVLSRTSKGQTLSLPIQGRQVSAALRDLLPGRFEDLAREFSSNKEFRDDMLRAQITALLIHLYRLFTGRAPIEVREHFDSLTSRFSSC
jgi:hypothetical protein